MSAHLKGTVPRRRLCGGPPIDVEVLKDFERWSDRGKSYGDAIGVLHAAATRLLHVDVVRSTPDRIRFRSKHKPKKETSCHPKPKSIRRP